MSKQRTKRRLEPPTPAKFKIGDCVRVRHGIRDEDHPDIPLGGWTGTISEIHKRGMYSVRWSRETLASIHPIYKKRCAIEGEVLEEYWLGEEDLEPDLGEPLAIEQPTTITPRPLSAENQSDRVRMVFGLTSDDLLPTADEDSLETYYDHLVERMSLPAEARHCPQEDFFDPSPLHRVKVVALDREIAWDEDEGILCKILTTEGEEVVPLADLEFRRSDPNHQLLDDFSAWFFGELSNYEDDEWDDEEEEEEDDPGDTAPQHSGLDVAKLMLQIIVFAISFGAVTGSAVAVMPWAKWGAYIGGGLLGVVEAVARARSAQHEWYLIASRFRKALGGVVGAITGAVEGALFGIMAVAFVGAILGGIAGALLKWLIAGARTRPVLILPGGVVLFAAACGVAAQAFYMDRAAATAGLWNGTLIGLGSGLLLCLVALPMAFLTVRDT